MENLDDDICYNALVTRDRRFDGRFYTAVLTTGIFCRPICPAVTPKRVNVEFYPTAEAAIARGFRPCLRCRPEAAPGSPARDGVHATVARAVRLIDEGALDHGTIADLAERLGIGERHFRRIFREYTGVAPQDHVKARRLLRARQLIADSNLGMTDIADMAGFGSLRRFNAAMKDAYGHAPTAFRRGVKPAGATRANDRSPSAIAPAPADPFAPRPDDLVLRLRARPPFDGDYLLSFFRARAIPGLETVQGRIYARGFQLVDGTPGLMMCHIAADNSGVDVVLRGPGRSALLEIGGRVRRLFDLDADIAGIAAIFANDPVLAPLVAKRPGLRVPGCWERFELAVRTVLGQQVSVAAARTLAGRLVAGYGVALPGDLVAGTGISHLFPAPDAMEGGDLIAIGLTRSRAQTLADVTALFARLGGADAGGRAGDAILAEMGDLRGIGPWTLNYFGLRGLGDPDAFPASDLGILKAAAQRGGPDTAKALLAHAENWRPWRAYGAQYLWSAFEGE